ncbi:craniofacial development protein 2-like [Elysia marginata]|uniref:Craniofacial development protein 2-like n=1 Tax=Elysia marginata TaxID=1093978 RepID=A0AAV4IGZ2_9GAST|nr:craniofacial development protein 2-like [Elysia marginata]
MNTFGPHKPSKRWTWHSPGGEYNNQIYHIMINCQFQSSVNIAQTRSFPRADFGGDHEPIMMIFALRLKKNKKRRKLRIKFDIDKLKDTNKLIKFQVNTGLHFYSHLTPDVLVETSNETLPKEASKLHGIPRGKKKKWMTVEILALCDKRRSLKKRKKDAESDKQYRETNLKVKRSI